MLEIIADIVSLMRLLRIKHNWQWLILGMGMASLNLEHEAMINGKRYPIRALMMSHMFVEVDNEVHAQDEVVLYNNDIRIDEFTFKGVGANSEQLSAMNHDSLIKEYI